MHTYSTHPTKSWPRQAAPTFSKGKLELSCTNVSKYIKLAKDLMKTNSQEKCQTQQTEELATKKSE